MPMTLEQLQSRGFIPGTAAERMGATEPGRLAAVLDKILYDASNGEITWTPLSGGQPTTGRRFHIEPKVYVSKMKDGTATDGYADVEATLREIRDYLEACALKETLER